MLVPRSEIQRAIATTLYNPPDEVVNDIYKKVQQRDRQLATYKQVQSELEAIAEYLLDTEYLSETEHLED